MCGPFIGHHGVDLTRCKIDRSSIMSRSLKSALAIAAIVVTLGLAGGPAAVTAGPFVTNGGATGCCRIAV
jgi:hypothetical protein